MVIPDISRILIKFGLRESRPPDPNATTPPLEMFVTAQDNRVCNICNQYHGRLYQPGIGPLPPLHPYCRCRRLGVWTSSKTPR